MDPLRVQWRNFRGIGAAQALAFPRLTVLIGRNNVGKTSAYAPLLALRQTLDARDPATALLSRGPIMDIGSYRDFVHNHDASRDVAFQLDIPIDPTQSHPDRTPRSVSMTFSSDATGKGDIWLKEHALFNEGGRPVISRKRKVARADFEVNSAHLPKNVSVGRPLREVAALRDRLSSEQPDGFMFTGWEALRLPVEWREDEDRWNKVRPWFNAVSELADLQFEAKYRLDKFLRSIAYLGPLRSLPQRTYRLAAERPMDVGREGEHAPEIVFRSRGTKLHKNVDSWLRTLGYGGLNFETAGDDYFLVYLCSGQGQRINIVDCGVGISQLLPMLVQGFTAPKNATFISQQPEIHLNPAQQSIIADFLIRIVADGDRRVIVETHSEHVLLRIRRRIAEGELDASDVAIYYFDSRSGRTIIQPVPLGTAGEIDEWPQGFFEEQLNDSFALSRAQVARAKRDADS